MWVSGSLISSSTWRSSSVSAPRMSSSIFLPSSRARSRTRRGSFCPGVADRLHARLHHAFLQLGGDVRQPLQRHRVVGVVLAPGDLQQLVAGQHELADHRHQVLEHIDVDADRLRRDIALAPSSSLPRFGAAGHAPRQQLRLSAAPAPRTGAWTGSRGRRARDRRAIPRRAAGALEDADSVGRGRSSCGSAHRPGARACRRRALRAAPIRSRSVPSGSVPRWARCSASISLMRSIGRQHEADGVAGHGRALAELVHQGLGGMGQRIEPGRPMKPQVPLMV